jgi:hypothetical protein
VSSWYTAQVAAQLQLSRLDTFCFLDDNPAEIGEVHAHASHRPRTLHAIRALFALMATA